MMRARLPEAGGWLILMLLVGILTAVIVAPAQACLASWYGPGFHGRKTASGKPFNQHGLTAAHRTYPFGTKVRVTYRKRSVVVTINDRGPYAGDRCIDLSRAAAERIGLIRAGVGNVTVQRIN